MFPRGCFRRSLHCAALFIAATGHAEKSAPPATFRGPFDAGLMADPRNREASGLAGSRRDDTLVWTHNDSGGEPVLYALDARDGSRRGRVRLTGVTNRDWEDLAAFTLDGQSWLLVADVGDNLARHPQSVLHLVPEPDPATLQPAQESVIAPVYSIVFIYEDGARDCEAVAVDPTERAVYLLSKRDTPPRLYRLPLGRATAAQPAVARLVGQMPHLPPPSAVKRTVPLPMFALASLPTAMDFAPDGSAAVVLTYGRLWLFPRAPGESWAEALGRMPAALPAHLLPQAEGACFRRDGRRILVCSEATMRMLRYEKH